jgi:hypothetical protein
MFRKGFAKEGHHLRTVLRWTCRGEESGSITCAAIMDKPGEERLELSYTRGSGQDRKDIEQTVHLCFTVPQYGGKRWWMECPFQHIRVAKLYLPPGGDRFASRQAWRLGYHIQRVAKNERACERLFELQKKLGGHQGLGGYPIRPKGMWRRTYERHLQRYWRLEEAAEAEFSLGLAQIQSRIKTSQFGVTRSRKRQGRK